ncbi:MAG TPA: gamma-glutamylcyclotransferase family protein [Hyphomicrobiaceae bacterium]|jgi:gamma-glutamylcyclotransferase (GGCT)/AIG2-like uncharacterized protein YtfP|nr:gamma-glutamylcyclotransferase family protein [Hyphomicrobiaceae bacterium]
MNPHLFVYGTLLSTAGHPNGVRLQREARLIGEASIPGRLYRIKHYPGLVEGSDPHPRVHGEAYALSDPANALKWLDAYEGITLGREGQSEYERVERSVRLASGEPVTAWVYLYRKDVAPHRLIPDGRWLSASA